jgi:uncharacterized protein YndB with AHSA1/START domain
MWTYEHSVDTTGSPAAVWSCYSDAAKWRTWDAGIEELEIHGPFEAGTKVTMKPAGQDPVTFTLVQVVPGELLIDETDFGGATLRFIHRLQPIAGGTRITHRVEIDGPAADEIGPELGPAVTWDLPEAMDVLAKLAGQ